MPKTKVAILYGGISAEHDISALSANSIIKNIDRTLFDVIPIEISKDGKFDEEMVKSADVVFPCLHGIGGEDGTIQGYLEEINKPYVGSGVKASALGLDKIASKQIWQKQNLPIPHFFFFEKRDWQENKSQIISQIKFPAFVKPYNTGSSLGISKIKDHLEIELAVDAALKIDNKIIVEEAIEDMREIEVSILGNEDLTISFPGEVIPSEEFYTFNAKYKGNSKTIIPAKISKEKKDQIQKLAESAYRALGCEGFARVDLFMKKEEGDLYLNEINTIPGFTEFSMFPKLMITVGLDYKGLLTRIIELGLKR